MENFNLNGFPTRFAAVASLPSPAHRRLCAVAHLSERRAPLQNTLHIKKFFYPMRRRGGCWEAVKVENQEHPSATSLHVFGLLATKKMKKQKC